MIDSSIYSFNYNQIAQYNAQQAKPAEKPAAPQANQQAQATQPQTPKRSTLDSLGQGRLP